MTLYFSTGNRGLVLMFILVFVTFFDLIVGKLKTKHVAAAFAFLVIVFVGGGYLRYGRFLDSAKKVGTSKIVDFALDNAYAYSGNGFWNLDYALQKLEDDRLRVPTYGASSLEGALWLISGYGPLQTAYWWDGSLNRDVMKRQGLNSTTFHWVLIKDFGVGAPLIWSFLWGLLLTVVDRYCRFRKDPGLALIQGHFAYYTFIGFNIFPFVLPLFWAGTGIQVLLRALMKVESSGDRSSK